MSEILLLYFFFAPCSIMGLEILGKLGIRNIGLSLVF